MENNPTLILLSAASGAVITSLLGPYFTQARDRRGVRAEVLRAIVEVEGMRWGDSDYIVLNKKLAALKAAGLIARADRNLVEYYASLALVSHRSGEKTHVGNNEYVWLVPGELCNYIDDTIAALSLTLWHPVRTWPIRRIIFRRLKKREQTVRERKDIFWENRPAL